MYLEIILNYTKQTIPNHHYQEAFFSHKQVLKSIIFYAVHSSLTPVWRQSICKEVQSRHPEPKTPSGAPHLLPVIFGVIEYIVPSLSMGPKICARGFKIWPTTASFLLISSTSEICYKFPSNYKPSQFWNVNFPLIISPSKNKSLKKVIWKI